jgi:molybdopterin-guanine dinucleotide biosynthesis protein A
MLKILPCAGIVLCGGESRRMASSKAWLPFGPELMLQRVVRLVGEAVQPVLVVAGADQPLPPLPPTVRVVHDRHPHGGPLAGLAAGLAAVSGQAEAAFVTACDAPLLQSALVRRMIELLADYEIAVPQRQGRDEPLAAVYRTRVLPWVEALLDAGRLRPAFLFDQVRTRRINARELADVDPQLQSLINVNTPADYHAALRRAGFAVPVL